MRPNDDAMWPALPYDAWRDTAATLHLWLQIVGKIQLMQSPWVNHSWHVALQVTARGLGTRLIAHGGASFQIELDFIEHRVIISTNEGYTGGFPLEAMTVAVFYRRLMDELQRLDLPVRISARPNELPEVIPFAKDDVHGEYDADAVHRFWLMLMHTHRVMLQFRARFIGKCSPIHLFWGAMDLAVTRFSGRVAPVHPGGIPNLPDRITREAYSHEVSSCGFWAGTSPIDYPAYYAYAYAPPPGFAEARVRPEGAFYSKEFGEFVLPYSRVRESANPDATLLEFFQSTYEAAADLGKWDRAALERKE